MTIENESLRNKLKAVELMCQSALATQPEEDDACRRHLEDALSKVRAALSEDS